MSTKILLAEDSQTIQKVVKISLADQGYIIDIVTDEESLLKKVGSEDYSILLLDSEISEQRSGYEISKEIKNLKPNTKVIILFGTFDNVEETKFNESNADNYISKPFDSSTISNLCKEVLSGQQATSFANDTEEGWSVGNEKLTSPTSEAQLVDNEAEVSPKDKIDSELIDWGMSIPEIIETQAPGSGEAALDDLVLPPVIDDNASETQNALNDENIYPQENDLEYPDIQKKFDEVKEPLTLENLSEDELVIESSGDLIVESDKSEEGQEDRRKPKFTNLDELNLEDADLDEPASANITATDFHAPNLLDEIEDENEDEFWATDDSEAAAEGEQFLALDKNTSSGGMNDLSKEKIDSAQLSDEDLKKRLEPIIKEIISDYLKESAEKVAWEVIPDLAENLIQKELKSIRDNIQQ